MAETILVTGGAGFVGSHTVVELVAKKYHCVIVDNLCNASEKSIDRITMITKGGVEFYSIDLLDKEALDKLFNKYNFKAVIHFAGLKAVGESVNLPLTYYHNNITGTLNLLSCMLDHNVYSLIFSSSATVYGTPSYLPIDENHPVGNCTNPYGRTKYFIEEILKDTALTSDKWKIVILRYFNPVGAHSSKLIGEDPMDFPNNLFPYVSQVAIGRRECLNVYGTDYETPDGTGVRDYVHITDLAKGHVQALENVTKTGYKVYNLGSGKGYSVLQIVNAMEKACGKKIPYKLCERRAGDIAECYADASLAFKELGWKTEKTLEDICTDAWGFQSANPMGYEGTQNGK